MAEGLQFTHTMNLLTLIPWNVLAVKAAVLLRIGRTKFRAVEALHHFL